jgi:hypothetical protein
MSLFQYHEHNTLSGQYIEDFDGTVQIVTGSQARSGNSCYRMNHSGQGKRVEAGSNIYYNRDVKFFRRSFFVPMDFRGANRAKGWTVMQVYNRPDPNAPQPNGWEGNGQLHIKNVTATTFDFDYLVLSHDYGTNTPIRHQIEMGTFQKGRWYDVIIEQPLTNNTNGYCKAYVGEKGQALTQRGGTYYGRTSYLHERGWTKAGLYASEDFVQTYLFIDELYVGRHDSSLAEMRPEGGTTTPPPPPPPGNRIVSIQSQDGNGYLGLVNGVIVRGDAILGGDNEKFELVPSGSNYKIRPLSSASFLSVGADKKLYANATEANAATFLISEGASDSIKHVASGLFVIYRYSTASIEASGSSANAANDLYNIVTL